MSDKIKPAAKNFFDQMHADHDLVKNWKDDNVSTGILQLDIATSEGGMPRGVLVDFFGNEGLGKSTICLVMAAEAVRRGEQVVYMDVEKKLPQSLIDGIIPNKSLFEVFRVATGEEVLEIVEKCAKNPDVKMIVVDSVAALAFKEDLEVDEETGATDLQRQVGLLARRISYFSMKLMNSLYQYGGICVFINQTRDKINIGYGKPGKVTTGGNAMRFYSSLRIGIHDEWSETKDTDGFAAGRKVKLHIEKNSFGAPHRDAMLSVQFGRGINRVRDLLDCGLELGVIERAGPYYKLTQVDGQGKKIREISGLGEEGFAEKVAPYLDEVRESIRLMVVAKSRKKRELEKKAIQDALQVQEEKREELKKKPPEKLAEVKAEEKK